MSVKRSLALGEQEVCKVPGVSHLISNLDTGARNMTGILTTGLSMRLLRWFLISGSVGIFVAVILGTSSAVDNFIGPAVRLVLWPSAFAGMADPSDLPEKFIVMAIMYGGNFVLYGAVGAAIGLFLGRVNKSS